ncbi:uncharacterized protein EKO05_0006781 [Ascochyta rabiei]|uniref:uncharacterized protein n=1 Tax=Didymella rabiei TaxID=5454 RepID=UPI0022078027|nr:uncharacterized protein EKO05_0006781 [Ascochyta rabiei]UPX16374.1 hypothetical protein EKO05_0006781 [Ascochyta rabiei]
MARDTIKDIQTPGLAAPLSSPDQSQPANRFRCDGAVQGFFDDDMASDADWKKFTDKGCALAYGLNGNDQEAGLQMGDKRTPPSAASPWTGDLNQELQTWEWSIVDPTTYSCKMNDHWKISEAMRSLGLNSKSKPEGGEIACYRVEHWDPKAGTPAINQWYTVDGIEYQFGTNTEGGAIFGFFLESPVYAASNTWFGGRKPANPSKLPQLRAFSDILWGYWVRENPNVRNIRFFFMMGISNDENKPAHRHLSCSEWKDAERVARHQIRYIDG